MWFIFSQMFGTICMNENPEGFQLINDLYALAVHLIFSPLIVLDLTKGFMFISCCP
jgi:hypothetical protein